MAKKAPPKNSPPMKKGKGYIAGMALAAMLAGCAVPGAPALPGDPIVRAKIVAVCAYSGLWQMVGNFAGLIPIPGITVAISLLNAGADRVCNNPDEFAQDASTVEWLIRQFRDAGKM
jgi:hypothetical protein